MLAEYVSHGAVNVYRYNVNPLQITTGAAEVKFAVIAQPIADIVFSGIACLVSFLPEDAEGLVLKSRNRNLPGSKRLRVKEMQFHFCRVSFSRHLVFVGF
ncbi:hypothetical protein D9M69_687880 [compost metagenome]